ncbi:MAG TPA: type II secretion system protein GspK [Gemmatimonadales bacterium]|nr:type II secretion system protein GspK [Gemmatimonadales bacterium]
MVTRRHQRGVALIFVLWLLVLLGVIVAEVASKARAEAALLGSLRSRTVARYAAESGILAATVRIEGLLDSTRNPPERAAMFRGLGARLASLTDVELADARFGVAAVDLNARIDLNRADLATLRGLFGQFTSEARADTVVAALKAAPIHRLAELSRVAGIDDSLALAVAPYVTVWSDGLVNLNSAPAPVLAALPGFGAAAQSIVARREAGEVFATIDLVRQPLLAAVGAPVLLVSTAPSRLMLVSRGWQEGRPLTHEIQAVFAIVGQRLVLQSSSERDL